MRGRSVPEGDFRTSSSMVMQEPPALVILARALSVKRRAATSTLGRSMTLASSVTVPTTTAVLELNREGGGQTRLNNRGVRLNLRSVSEVLGQLGERDGGSHGSRGDESSEDSFAEL